MKKLRVLIVLTMTLGALLFYAQPALAIIYQPSEFWGTVMIDGVTTTTATVVGKIGGTPYATATWESGYYVMRVPSDDTDTSGVKEGGVDGDTIDFYVDGLKAPQTGTWHSGTIVRLDLTAYHMPGAFGKSSPSKGATGVAINTTLSWTTSSNATSYKYCIATSTNCTPSDQTSGTSSPALSLVNNTTYYWQVQGVNNTGTILADDGTYWSFTTISIAPTATTGTAGSITSTGATLNGTVNAHNASTTVTFQYGTSTSYGTTVTASPGSVSGTADTAVSAAITGLTPSTQYHFRVVATNATGTTNGADATFTTSAAAPTATTGTAGSITTTGATLNGTVNANNASTTVTFQYGTSTSYGSSATATQSPVTGTNNTAVSAAITGLTTNTLYHFRVVAVNATGTTNGADATFTTTATAPTATTGTAGSITTTGATLNGTVNANGASTTVTFQYGTSTSYGSTATATQSPVTGTASTAVSAAITGLTPNTLYHFRVVGVNTGGTTNGSDATFTTTAAAPTATTGAAASITTTGATLNGTVNANNASTTVTFQYGLTTSYGSTATATQSPVTGTTSTAVSAAITGLTTNTLYHFRVVAVNATGTTNGSDATFTTTAAAPTATTGAAASITTTGATLNGTINANGASTIVTFQYGTTTSYGSTATATQSPVTGTTSTAVSAAITGLIPNTLYHFRVVAVNAGGTTNGSDATFTTSAAAPTATTGTAGSITSTGATLNGTVNANNASTTVTFQYGTTTSYGTTVTATQSPVTGTTATAVSASITGLTANTTYHFRVVGVNTGGTTNGSDASFTTSIAVPGAFSKSSPASGATGQSITPTLSWGTSSGATSYEYCYATTTGCTSWISVGTATSVGLTGLSNNTLYYWQVRAVNAGGTTQADTGTYWSFTTSAVPGAFAKTSPANGATGVALAPTLSWGTSSNATSYEYCYATTTGCTSWISVGTANSVSLSGLLNSQIYYWQVRAVNAGGTTQADSGTYWSFTTLNIYRIFMPLIFR